jgi:heme/copper-type cytochrome/quinol oxidase subunit 2
MADKKIIEVKTSTGTAVKETALKTPAAPKLPLFEKENYTWMIIGVVIIAIGMLVMSGGKNTEADKFDYNVVYSTMRITVAPILILLGLMVEIYAIFKRPKAHKN